MCFIRLTSIICQINVIRFSVAVHVKMKNNTAYTSGGHDRIAK